MKIYSSRPFYWPLRRHLHERLSMKDSTVDSTNYYQLNKIRFFLDDLQQNSLIKTFSSTEYRSLVTIPQVKLIKSKNNVWTATVWIAEELFDYAHPFLFPDLFHSKSLTKHQVAVLFEILVVFTSTLGLQKQFYFDQFFEDYSQISNQEKTKMKQAFLFFIQEFQEKGLIEDSIQILPPKSPTSTTTILISQLKVSHLSNGFILYSCRKALNRLEFDGLELHIGSVSMLYHYPDSMQRAQRQSIFQKPNLKLDLF